MYQQSDHALPDWKCVMQCSKCPSVNIPDQESYDKYSDTSPSIRFHIYHLIARFLRNVRLPLYGEKNSQV